MGLGYATLATEQEEVSSMSIEQFRPKPKVITEKYKDQVITIEFDPERKLWHWKFEIPANVITVEGLADNATAAAREAKKQVDKIKGDV